MKKEFALEKTYDITATIQIVIRTNGKYYAEIVRNFDDLWNENDEYECWIENDGQLMTEPVTTEKEYDAIIETFCSYIKKNGIKYARICDKCGNGMNEGYVVNGGCEYYCTPECLHKVYTPKEWQEMYGKDDDDNNSDNYWTEWDTEGCEYVLFNNQLITI